MVLVFLIHTIPHGPMHGDYQLPDSVAKAVSPPPSVGHQPPTLVTDDDRCLKQIHTSLYLFCQYHFHHNWNHLSKIHGPIFFWPWGCFLRDYFFGKHNKEKTVCTINGSVCRKHFFNIIQYLQAIQDGMLLPSSDISEKVFRIVSKFKRIRTDLRSKIRLERDSYVCHQHPHRYLCHKRPQGMLVSTRTRYFSELLAGSHPALPKTNSWIAGPVNVKPS